MVNGYFAHKFCTNSVDTCFLALTLFWELVWHITFDQKLMTNGRRTGRFHSYVGDFLVRKVSFTRCVIV